MLELFFFIWLIKIKIVSLYMKKEKFEKFELVLNSDIFTKGVFVNQIDYGFWIEKRIEKIYYAR